MPNRSYPRFSFASISSKGLRIAGLLAFFAVVFAPVAALAADFAAVILNGHREWLMLMLPSGRLFTLFIRSAGLAAGVAIAASLLGVLLASVAAYWGSGRMSRLRWMLLATALLPPYVHAMAWDSLFFWMSTVAGGFVLNSWLASWWVQTMAMLPLATGIALLSIESVDQEMVNMARLMQPDFKVFTAVVLPLAAPLVMAGAGLLFVISITDYAIPSLYNLQVYSLEIFADFSAHNEPGRSLALAVPLLASIALVIALAQSSVRDSISKPARSAGQWMSAPLWHGWPGLLQVCALIILGLQFVVPVTEIAIKTGSWDNFVSAINMAHGEIAYSVLIASLAGLISLPLGIVPALEICSNSKHRGSWLFVMALPIAIPASMAGIGLISIWNQPFLQGIYGGTAMPVLAALARFAPIAALILYAQRRRLDPAVLDAARLMQPGWSEGFLHVQLPLMRPGMVAAALAVFILTLGELGATLLVAPPGQATMTMRIYNLMHYGASSSVAGLCLLIVIAGLAAGAASVFILSRASGQMELNETGDGY